MNDSDVRHLYADIEAAVVVPSDVAARLAGRSKGYSSAARSPRSAVRNLGVIAAVATVAIGATAVANRGSDATSPPPSSSNVSQEPTASKLTAFEFSNRLQEIANRDDRFVGAAEVDRGTHITLYGAAAAAPSPIRDVIAEAPDGVEVTWVEVPFTETQLLAAIALAEEHLPRVVSAAYGGNGFDHVEVAVQLMPGEDLADVQALADSLDTPVPIQVSAGHPATAL